jgi:hypothetical protein
MGTTKKDGAGGAVFASRRKSSLFLLTDRKPNRETGAKQNDAASRHEYQIGISGGCV